MSKIVITFTRVHSGHCGRVQGSAYAFLNVVAIFIRGSLKINFFKVGPTVVGGVTERLICYGRGSQKRVLSVRF